MDKKATTNATAAYKSDDDDADEIEKKSKYLNIIEEETKDQYLLHCRYSPHYLQKVILNFKYQINNICKYGHKMDCILTVCFVALVCMEYQCLGDSLTCCPLRNCQ